MTGPAARPPWRAGRPGDAGRALRPVRSRASLPCSVAALVVRAYRRSARYVAAVRDRLPNPVGQQRHVDVADAGAGDRVNYRVDEGRRTADGRALADALGPDRVVRARRDHLAVQLEARRLPGGGQQVIHVVRADAVALGIERDELHVGHGIGLGQAAHDLALDDHRVDPDAAVVDGHDVQHVPDSAFRVDLDGDEVNGERPGQVRRVLVSGVLKARLHSAMHIAVRRHRAFLDCYAAVRRTADVEPAEFPLDVLLRHLEQMRRQPPCLGPDLPRHHGYCGACDRGAAGGVGAHAERRGVGVALLDDHVLSWQPELVRDDLCPAWLVALSLRLGAGPHDRLPGHVGLDLGRVDRLYAKNVLTPAITPPQPA